MSPAIRNLYPCGPHHPAEAPLPRRMDMHLSDDPRWHEIERTLDELIGAIDTNVVGCVEIEKRGEAARKLIEELRREVSNQDSEPKEGE